jgi:hypothetical protein
MKRYTEERFMTILWDIYSKTNNGLKMLGYKEFCKSHNVTTIVFPILVKHKVLERSKVPGQGRGKSYFSYTWNTIQPNIYMAKKLMDEIIKINKEGNAKHQLKLKQQKLELLQKQQGTFETVEIQEEQVKVENLKEETSSISYKVFNHLTQTFIDPNDPFNAGISNPVTLSSSPVISEKEDLPIKQQSTRKISICWGLIYIQW